MLFGSLHVRGFHEAEVIVEVRRRFTVRSFRLRPAIRSHDRGLPARREVPRLEYHAACLSHGAGVVAAGWTFLVSRRGRRRSTVSGHRSRASADSSAAFRSRTLGDGAILCFRWPETVL